MFKKIELDMKLIRQLDFKMLFITIVIGLFGVLNIYLTTKGNVGFDYAKKQLMWIGISMVLSYIVMIRDYTLYKNLTPILYWGSVILLIITRFAGVTVNGARGWIDLGFTRFQPAELAKIALIMMLAKKLDEMDCRINNVKNFFILAFYAIVPAILIVTQPDMGMTMVCFFIVLGIFFLAGLDMKIIGGGLLSLVIAIIIVWNSGIIQTYQQRRFISFLNPEADELGAGLQLSQSMIGIGSGGLTGVTKDFTVNGATGYVAQNVPENHTDFIFAVVGEHWGFIGALFLLSLYGILIHRMLMVSKTSKDIYGMIIAGGMASYFLFAIIQNIGMTIGIMPITGITLPLFSYGGSSFLTTMMSIALILNISMRRKKINF